MARPSQLLMSRAPNPLLCISDLWERKEKKKIYYVKARGPFNHLTSTDWTEIRKLANWQFFNS